MQRCTFIPQKVVHEYASYNMGGFCEYTCVPWTSALLVFNAFTAWVQYISEFVATFADGALLPMDSVDLEMELESDDDELIIGARPQLVQMDDISVDTTRDTQPIITVSQAELTEGAKSRRKKLNVLVIVGVVVLFLIVFGVSLFLLVYFSKA